MKRKFNFKLWCIDLVENYDPIKALDRKEELLKELEKIIGKTNIKKIKKDSHSYRIPRPCGITVHPGIGCPNKCLYCYLVDFGPNFQTPKPYKLNGLEISLSLLYNKWFVPGKMGTFIAIGSVCEPFHPICYEKTIDYLKSFAKYLKNPMQFSTKAFLNTEQVHEITEAINKQPLSTLVTIITIKNAKKLEPNVPSPEKRFETISNLRDDGFKPLLFLRPIIPGVTDKEFEEIFEKASNAGAIGVVLGSFRISRKILERLKRAHVNLRPIKERATKIGEKQIYLRGRDLKETAFKLAKEFKLTPFNSVCCANAFNASVPCINVCWLTKFCAKCPSNCKHQEIHLSTEKVDQVIKRILDVQLINLKIEKNYVRLVIRKDEIKKIGRERKGILELLKTLSRRKIEFKII